MMVILYILLVFSCQLSAVSGQQSFSETESWIKSQGHKVAMSQSDCLSDSAPLRPYDFYESQIRLADSLYKNYLPQYNFEEVKKAMEFFERERDTGVGNGNPVLKTRTRPQNLSPKPVSESRTLLCAKAHYYHAVGLTERDDIIGACEHYLRALEIMEPETENLKTSKSGKKAQSRKAARSQGDCLSDSATAYLTTIDRCLSSVDHPEDYEKIRFLALTYTRLGRLFTNENYCDLAIMKYKKALNYYDIINDTVSVSNVYKFIANSYQLLNKQDSALYYYKESLKISSCITNRLDIEKNIGQIMFDKGKRDTAYIIIKNCLDIIENENVRYSYYSILGKMYLEDKDYDTAVYYLSESINSDIQCIKVTSAIMLSSIYDSIGDHDKKAYYNEIISELSINDFNKNIERSKLQKVYDKYRERIKEKDKIENRKKIILIVSALIVLVLISVVVAILIWHKSKRKDKYIAGKEEIISGIHEEIKHNEERMAACLDEIEKLKTEINQAQKNLDDLRFRSSLTEGKIKSQNAELKKKEDLIKKYATEISNLKYKLERKHIDVSNLNNYLQSDVCSKILNEINEFSDKKLKSNMLSPLSKEEFVLLLHSANHHLNYFINDMAKKYPKLKNEDLYYLCLVIMGLNKNQIASLFGVTYDTAKKREKKICAIFDLDPKENLSSYLSHLV